MTSTPSLHPDDPSSRPVALVTGAGRRIGRAIALELGRRGWALALHYRQSAEAAQALAGELAASGVVAQTFKADLANEPQTRSLAEQVIAGMGRWNAVINNASLFEYDCAATLTYATLEAHWRTNTAAPLLLSQLLHAHLERGGGPQGCVVNLLDQKLWNPNPDYLSYTLSKAALEAANTLLAQALAPGVRVCGVAPGVTLVSGPMTAAGFEQAHTMTPLHRSSTPEDIAKAVAFLLESPAITGTTLLVDGGQHLSSQPRDVLFLTPQSPANGA